MTILTYDDCEEKIIELRQQLASREAQIVMLRDAILQFRNEPLLGRAHAIRRTKGYAAMGYAAIDATDDLDGLILCEKKPAVETLSVVTNTGYVYVRAIDRKVEPNTQLYRAWEPKP